MAPGLQETGVDIRIRYRIRDSASGWPVGVNQRCLIGTRAVEREIGASRAFTPVVLAATAVGAVGQTETKTETNRRYVNVCRTGARLNSMPESAAESPIE